MPSSMRYLKMVTAKPYVYIRFSPRQLLDPSRRKKIAEKPSNYISMSSLGFQSKEELKRCLADENCVRELVEALCTKLRRGELRAGNNTSAWIKYCCGSKT